MGFEFLVRVRQSSLWFALLAALFVGAYVSYAAGLGLAAGAAFSIANLWLLERIVVAVVRPGPRGWDALRQAGLAGLGNLALFAAGAALLTRLPVAALMSGFAIPFAVLTLKAVSRVLLESAAWARFTRSRWRAAITVVAVAALLGLGISALTRADAETPGGHGAATTEAAAGAPQGESAASEHAATQHAAESGPKKFDTVLSLLVHANEGRPWAHVVHRYEVILFSLLVAVLLAVVAVVAMRGATPIPRPLQNAVEATVETVYNQVVDVLGPVYGPRYVPFLGSLFIYILAMNLFGIIPMMESPTSSLNVTFALAITVVVYVHYTAIRELGLGGWLHHLAGSPHSGMEWGLVILMFPIHVIGELAKPVSLSCRLFGNIFGEDMLLVGFAGLGITTLAAMGLHALPFGLPLQFPFLFLALLTSVVQALVFSLLSTIYFLLMLPHDHGHEVEAHHAH